MFISSISQRVKVNRNETTTTTLLTLMKL